MPKLKLPEGEGAVKLDGRSPQIIRDLGVKPQGLAAHGMLEGEPLGVQPETMAGNWVAVHGVCVHRMPDGREVDPYLVCPPRLWTYAEHGTPPCARKSLEVRDGRLSHASGHERRVVGVTAYRGV